MTGTPRSSLRRQLEKLVATNQIKLNGKGKGSWYTLG
jgi:hypothetical protein